MRKIVAFVVMVLMCFGTVQADQIENELVTEANQGKTEDEIFMDNFYLYNFSTPIVGEPTVLEVGDIRNGKASGFSWSIYDKFILGSKMTYTFKEADITTIKIILPVASKSFCIEVAKPNEVGRIKVKLQDEEGNPLKQELFYLKTTDRILANDRFVTDSEGEVAMNLLPGNYTIHYASETLGSADKEITVKAGDQIDTTVVVNQSQEEQVGKEQNELDTVQIKFEKLNNEKYVTKNVTLPEKTSAGTQIKWTSSNEKLVTNKGKVTRPKDKSTVVTLTATVGTEKDKKDKKFEVHVIKALDSKLPKDNSYQDIVKINGGEPRIYSLGDDGIPTFIYAKITDMNIGGYEDAIRSLYSIKTIMHMENPEEEFILLNKEKTDIGVFYKLQQTFGGVEVEGHQMIVKAQDGKVTSVNGHYVPFAKIAEKVTTLNPKVKEEELKGIIEKEFNVLISKQEAELVICFNDANEPYLCWRVGAMTEEEQEYLYTYIDAMTGKITR